MNAKVSATIVSPETKTWTDYSTGIAWKTVALFVGVSVAYISMIVAIYLEAMSLLEGMVLATVLIYLGFTVVHEAGHGNIAHEVTWMKPIERFMGWVMTLLFFIMPFGLFAKIHDYHHAFTNDPDRDPDHWVSGDTWLQASLRAPTLALNYLYLTMTRFKDDPVITKTHMSSMIYFVVTGSISMGLILSGFALEFLVVGVIPIFLASYILGMLFDWIPHMPTRQQGRYQNTRSYLFPGLKYLTMGQSYHHIHHLYPRVSWFNYQRVFDLIRPELEAKNAPIEALFSNKLPRFGLSKNAREPSSIDGIHKLTLNVQKIHQETADAVAISFKNLDKPLPFKAGQYITITKLLNGEAITRCYSICESPNVGELTVGVKRVEGGLLSTYLNNDLNVGDELTVTGPFGSFYFDPKQSTDIDLVTLIAGGSGITPNLAIAKTALNECPSTLVHLIYANRSITDLMFLNQLNQLLSDYPDRFTVTNIFEKSHGSWTGETGYLTEEKLINMLAEQGEPENGQYFICGPTVMKDIVVSTLEGLNIGSDRIFVEEFGQSAPKAEGPLHKVNIHLANGSSHELSVAENQTVLQVATQEGIKIPHACGVGQCGCCMMQVTAGDSELAVEETPGLLPGEQANGLTLACQCRPKSALSLKEDITLR